MSTEKVQHEYGADEIQILEGLEAVRKRPGMYIGSTSLRGLHHLVYEIVDNSVDEALAGFCDTILVIINKDNSVTVIDNGRGIPTGINHKAGLPAVEVVFTVLHAGGKFGGGGYKVSGGLHGVGASVVNALSNWLEVEISKDGKIYKQRYERGKVVDKLRVIGECEEEKSGTKVTFMPDDTIFEETVFDYDVLKQRFRMSPSLIKPMFRSSTWIVTVMTVVFWMVTTASPDFTSPPSAMVQEIMVPSMGAVALRASTAAWASFSRSRAAVSCSSRLSEPMVSRACPADTRAWLCKLLLTSGPPALVVSFRLSLYSVLPCS